MSGTPEPADARRALLAKYLRGEVPQRVRAAGGSSLQRQIKSTPLLKAAEAERAPDARVRLVPIQTTGSRRPIFYVHVHNEGGAFYCFTLARDLGADQPLYLLEPYRFDGLRIPPPLEAMAAAYIESLRSVQPGGPYRLVAFCGGSPIALEMAQQLRAAGQAVELLVLIEPGVISRLTPLLERYSPTLLRVASGCIRRLGGLMHLGPDKQLDCFLGVRHAYRCLRRAHYRQGVSLVPTTETLRQDWLGMYIWVESQYRPRPYPGKVTCFWARDESRNRAVAWHKLAPAAETEDHIIPGTHTTCRTHHLHALADHLGACLRAVPQ